MSDELRPDLIRVLVVDDEPLARRGVRQLLRDLPHGLEVFEAVSGEDAIELIRAHSPDVVFLDVQMPRVDGFTVVETIGAAAMPPTIFVTAYDQHALKAFEAQAVDYLLKPIDPDRFRDAFDRACRAATVGEVVQLRRALAALAGLARAAPDSKTAAAVAEPVAIDRRLRVRQDRRVILVDPDEVDWIESVGNYVVLHLRGGELRHRATLAEMHELLGGAFVRIRRAILVRAAAVRYCEPYGKGSFVVVLHDQKKLISSRYFRSEMTPLLGR